MRQTGKLCGAINNGGSIRTMSWSLIGLVATKNRPTWSFCSILKALQGSSSAASLSSWTEKHSLEQALISSHLEHFKGAPLFPQRKQHPFILMRVCWNWKIRLEFSRIFASSSWDKKRIKHPLVETQEPKVWKREVRLKWNTWDFYNLQGVIITNAD